ncbi:ATP-binding cassette transporter, putative [Cordyceps militaris CM01]|uniref:ATP-binding cassette transporter, putative n=1 Tax=Cordyceps militaris (strain CM01) TaxID=983644 RepID=G3JKG7_CORMM|nr:ATP-binding cassette transporter, putative [Cordyceps militaris CM01]EGX92245.1 ATP-binding cassette transporter, putative [Cordyceps militaris CM01]
MAGIMGESGQYGADALFGPQLPGRLDFTTYFENTILSILPNGFFVAGSLICLHQLFCQPRLVRRGFLWWLKLTMSALLLATDLGALTLSSLAAEPTNLAVAAAATSCLASVLVIILADTEHRRSLHSSGWLSFCLGLYALLGIAKARSFFLRAELHSLAILQSLDIGIMAVILVLGEVSKFAEIIDPEQRDAAGPEALAGFWNRSCFFWLLQTLYAGSKRLLNVHDLHTLEDDLQGDRLFANFVPIWSRWNKRSSKVLFKVLIRTLLRSILVAVVPRLALIGFSFSQPYLLERVVLLLESKNPRDNFENGLVGAAALIYIGITVSRAWYNYLAVRMATKTRGILIAAIYDKTVKLEHNQAKKLAAVTLMSTDADGVTRNARTLYEFAANLLELAVGITILALRVGPACILLLAPTALLSATSTKFGKKVGPSQVTWNKSIEDRVSKTSAILGQIRTIKMVGQGPAATDYIQELRKKEIDESQKYRFLQAALLANAMLIYCLTPISVIAGYIFWTRPNVVLKSSDIFTILSIVAIVSTPLSKVVASYPGVAATFGRLQRIESFLLLPERIEQREFIGRPLATGSISGEAEKLTHCDEQSWDIYPADVHQVSISATKTSGTIIPCSTFSIPRRKFTMVVGKTGCGKSTLLRGLLGEAIVTEGTISLERAFVAYCDEQVWIQNRSIRENLICASNYDARWYSHVLSACQLLSDIQSFPSGDQTIVGSDGLKLSGGQKARLALARAVYALAPLILLDDIFSAIDEKTADGIMNALLGPQGVLRRTACTVVLATSSGTSKNT